MEELPLVIFGIIFFGVLAHQTWSKGRGGNRWLALIPASFAAVLAYQNLMPVRALAHGAENGLQAFAGPATASLLGAFVLLFVTIAGCKRMLSPVSKRRRRRH